MAGKVEYKKLKEYENENYFFGDQTSGTSLIIGWVSGRRYLGLTVLADNFSSDRTWDKTGTSLFW